METKNQAGDNRNTESIDDIREFVTIEEWRYDDLIETEVEYKKILALTRSNSKLSEAFEEALRNQATV